MALIQAKLRQQLFVRHIGSLDQPQLCKDPPLRDDALERQLARCDSPAIRALLELWIARELDFLALDVDAVGAVVG